MEESRRKPGVYREVRMGHGRNSRGRNTKTINSDSMPCLKQS